VTPCLSQCCMTIRVSSMLRRVIVQQVSFVERGRAVHDEQFVVGKSGIIPHGTGPSPPHSPLYIARETVTSAFHSGRFGVMRRPYGNTFPTRNVS
jgi:hypothetical protein